MQLILAIDSDPRRSEQLAAVVRAKLTVDLVQATSAGEGLHALRDRVPDLILTSPLLSPFDDGVLDEYLRDLGAAATHVQTLRIPVLSASPKRKSAARSLFSLGRKKPKTSSAAPDGCDPKVFADEIAHYLTRSLEERSAFAKVGSLSDPTETALADGSRLANHPTDRSAARTPAQVRPAQIQPDSIREELVPEALIEEFTQPVYEPEPVYVPVYEPEPVYRPRAVEHAKPVEDIASVTAAPVVVEETLVPGSILGLRSKPKVIVVAKSKVVVEPELPTIVEPELQAIVRPEPPPIVEPELQAIVQPEPPAIVEPERPAIVKPVAASQPEMVSTPATTPATATGTSPSFEAALAAIRAAWVKPEAKKNVAAEPVTSAHQPPVSPSNAPVTGSPKPLAGSGEVDLTNEIDALEDVVGVDGTAPGTDDEPSPDESKTPSDRRKVDKSKKRPEKARGRKMRGPDGRDDLGVFDPNQCGFSALVNKLDEVTEDEVTERATTTVR